MTATMIDTTIRNLSDYLDWLEVHVMEDTNMNHTNGGYCNAEPDGHDEEYIYIKIIWSECTDNGKTENPEYFKIAISVLNDSNLTLVQKYAKMQDRNGV